MRVVEAGQADGETDGTRAVTALGTTLADVPTDRVAGVIMITDGRVHDVPQDAGALGFAHPFMRSSPAPRTSATAASR